jgi:hypothetical protein
MPLPARDPFVCRLSGRLVDPAPFETTPPGGDAEMLDHDCRKVLPRANTQVADVMMWIYT